MFNHVIYEKKKVVLLVVNLDNFLFLFLIALVRVSTRPLNKWKE